MTDPMTIAALALIVLLTYLVVRLEERARIALRRRRTMRRMLP